MSDLPIIALAHGRQERLVTLPFPKQFLDVGGEGIIERTSRILGNMRTGFRYVVAPTGVPQWAAFCEKTGAHQLGLSKPVSVVKSVNDLLSFSPIGAIFLLGDVVFSTAALRFILCDQSSIAFYGKPGANYHTGKGYDETYAMRVSGADAIAAVKKAASREHEDLPWKLRDLRLALDLQHVVIADWTDDVDTDVDVVSVLPKLREFVRRET